MTAINPPGFLQNVGSTNTAELTRNAVSLGHSLGRLSAGSLKPLGGVMRNLGSALAVVENGTPNMTVNVGSGACYIPGTEGTTQGMYNCVNNGTVNVSLAAANATNPRIDLICYKVEDQVYSGSNNTSSIVAVTGTPASSPSPPAAPNNSLTLCQILVPANDTAITNSQITDKRRFLTGPGGVIYCSSTTRPDTATIDVGQLIWESNTELFRVWDGINFALVPYTIQETTLGSDTATVTFNNIPSEIKTLRLTWRARTTNAGQANEIRMRINNVSTNDYYGQYMTQIGASAPSVFTANAAAHARVGAIPGAGAQSGLFGAGSALIPGWNGPGSMSSLGRLSWTAQCGFFDSTSVCYNETSQWLFVPNSPYTRIDLFSAANFLTGSQFTLEALS